MLTTGMAHFWTRLVGDTTLFDFGEVESRLSQTIFEKVKNCYKEGSNSRRQDASLVTNHYANSFHMQL